MWRLLLFTLTADAGAIVTGLMARRGSVRPDWSSPSPTSAR
jgi:hypothetical protein